MTVEDADAQTDAEQALFGEPGLPPPREGWQHSRVVALFPERAPAEEAARLLLAQDFFAGARLLGIDEVAEQDWVRLTQSQFEPVEITPEFWIVPTWHEPPAQATQIIRLDPGLAFGTGTPEDDAVKIGVIVGSVVAALLAAVALRVRNTVYRRLAEEEAVDSDLDGTPDVYQQEPPRD